MNDIPNWLPELVLLRDFGGYWPEYLNAIYQLFLADFVHTGPVWPDRRMGLKRHPFRDGKEATFWHFIQEGPIEDKRMPDIRRCERIRWPRKVIDCFQGNAPAEGDRILWWKNRRRGEDRFLLTLTDFSYLVVMTDRKEYVLPWTAYNVEHQHTRLTLKAEYDTYWHENG